MHDEESSTARFSAELPLGLSRYLFPPFLAGKELRCCYSNLSVVKSLETRFIGRDNIFY